MFNLQYISVRHLKDSIRISEDLPTGNVHVPPLGFKVVRAKLAAQEHVSVMEAFGEFGRILRIACADEHIADRSREEDFAHPPVRLTRTHSLTTRAADQIAT
jgi:hypothetical protein